MQELLNCKSEANYIEVLKITIDRIVNLSKKIEFSNLNEEDFFTKIFLLNLKEYACETIEDEHWNVIQEKAENLFNSISKIDEFKVKERNLRFKLLTPWQDLGIILQNLDNNNLQILEKAENVYLESESESEEWFGSKIKRTHAEVKLANKIYKDRKIGNLKKNIYIGSNKLSCSHCKAIIEFLNIDEFKFEMKGYHGIPEKLCKDPSSIKKSFKSELVKARAEQIAFIACQSNFPSQTTSEKFTELLNPIKMIRDRLNLEKDNEVESLIESLEIKYSELINNEGW